ncbi:glycosyl transferase, group 1 family protein [Microscilla marina ATCC 23134]|uniref:Glycosyl transferase, group 1 family protein n=2 Tax=Microscilla marina TaxID=1027 RepID=A1ZCJ0_MICM2|nr:glycosyl transferase, group 1 family protein [Microscilla marina ATCC 23134]
MQASGVQKKVVNKIKALNQLGLETKGLFISSANKEVNYPDLNIKVIPYQITNVPKIYSAPFFWRFHVYYENKIFYETIDVALQEEDFDLILFRYPIWYADFNFLRFMKKYHKKIVFEHNTIEIVEMQAYNREGFRQKYLLFNENKIAPKALKHAKGIVGVCGEITDYEAHRVNHKVESRTIANGFDVASVRVRTPPAYNKQELTILLSAGFAGKWHGVDRLIEGLHIYKGEVQVKLKIIGNVLNEIHPLIKKYHLEDKVEFLGNLDSEAAAVIFDECHIAASSMAMHRNGLQEASTLKTREYLSRGIPFFISNIDVDTENNESIAPYYLKIPGDDSPVNIEDVVSFAERVLQLENHPTEMRGFAESKVDFQLKMKQLKDFLEQLSSH